jgi:hypothetical protein
MTATLTSTNNNTIKVKRPREDRFCIFLLFFLSKFCFVVGCFFYALIKFRIFFITNNVVLIFKLSTIESFYYTK